jgi:hypothetical protein
MKGTEVDLKAGDRVRIKSLTDVDTKEPAEDEDGLVGRTAIVVEPFINDYYDCIVEMEGPVGELGKAYGNPPTLAMLYVDLEHV